MLIVFFLVVIGPCLLNRLGRLGPFRPSRPLPLSVFVSSSSMRKIPPLDHRLLCLFAWCSLASVTLTHHSSFTPFFLLRGPPA